MSKTEETTAATEVSGMQGIVIYKVANLPILENLIQIASQQLEALQGTMNQIRSFELTLERVEYVPNAAQGEEAVEGTTAILQANIQITEARRRMAEIKIPLEDPNREVVLKSIDCSLQSLRQQLLEQHHR